MYFIGFPANNMHSRDVVYAMHTYYFVSTDMKQAEICEVRTSVGGDMRVACIMKKLLRSLTDKIKKYTVSWRVTGGKNIMYLTDVKIGTVTIKETIA